MEGLKCPMLTEDKVDDSSARFWTVSSEILQMLCTGAWGFRFQIYSVFKKEHQCVNVKFLLGCQ
jgi:hypothetical protein